MASSKHRDRIYAREMASWARKCERWEKHEKMLEQHKQHKGSGGVEVSQEEPKSKSNRRKRAPVAG